MLLRFILAFICALCYTGMRCQPMQFRHYTVNDGLCSNTVYYSMQDSKGYMWFCTEAGINRFDGKRFESFTIKDGLSDNDNFRCLEDSKGRLWFSGYNGKLCYFNGVEFKNPLTDPGLKDTDSLRIFINGMIEDKSGIIWFSKFGNKSIYRCNTSETKKIKLALPGEEDYPENRLFFIYNDTACFFYTKRNDCIYRYNIISGKRTPLIFPGYIETEAVMRPYVQTKSNGSFYYLSIQGLRHFLYDSIVVDINNTDLADKERTISTFMITNGNLWLGTNKGLLLIRNFEKEGFKNGFDHYLENVFISHISTDAEGGTWFATMSEGVFYLPASQAYITNIPIKSVTAIGHSGYKDNYAVGTYYGNFMLLSGDKIIDSYQCSFIRTSRIRAIKWISPGELFIGLDYGLYSYSLKNKKINFFLKEFGQVGFSDMDDSRAGKWISGRGIIFLCHNNLQELIHTHEVMAGEKINSITAEGKIGCWYTSANRLYRFNLQNRKVTETAVFNSSLRDCKYINGYLWVATDGDGLYIYKNNKQFAHLHSNNTRLTGNICQKLFADGKNRMWVATNKGISVFDIYTFKFIMSFTTNDILISPDVKDLDIYNNKVYAATTHGISIIDLNKFAAVTAAPKIYVKKFTANDVSYSLMTPPAFNYFNGTIKLQYTAITFQSRESVVYRYKINNKDSLWNETTAEELEFYNLAPGVYKLDLCAKKYNSNWSAPLHFNFTILPLWYQTTFFRFLLACFIILSGVIISYLIIRSNKRKSDTQRRMLESELKAIRLYMNPHFIFNSLSSLQLFIFKNKSPEAGIYISKFAKLIRWIMMYSEKQEITLADEIEFLKTYIALEQSRFDNGFELILNIDDSLNATNTYIPPLVIQPIVENAIRYGLAGKSEAGTLKIGFEKRDGLIIATIEDNGVGRNRVLQEQALSPNKTRSTGIKYTEERLKLLLKERKTTKPVSIEDLVENSVSKGTLVKLIIPILQ